MHKLSPTRLVAASVRHFRRTHLATGFAQAVLTAAMAGALLVGDSVRTSLHEAAVSRIEPYEYAAIPNRFVRAELAKDINDCLTDGAMPEVEPMIQMVGGADHANSGARAGRVQILGVQAFFLHAESVDRGLAGRNVILNDVLARELKAKQGNDIILRIKKPTAVSEETLLGRRDENTVSLRVTVQEVIPTKGLAAFSLNPADFQPRNAFVPLVTLQRAIEQPDQTNTLLFNAWPNDADYEAGRSHITSILPMPQQLQKCVDEQLALADLGLTLRNNPDNTWLSLESTSFLIDPQIESAAQVVIQELNTPHTDVLAYLANTITLKQSEEPGSAPRKSRDVPYSIVVALNNETNNQSSLKLIDGTPAPDLEPGQILLNDWTAAELGAKESDAICLDYYITADFGQLETRDACFTVRGIVTTASTADPTWTPEYKGITDAKNLADWNPPFPLEIARIKSQDEDYWDQYTAAPKAIISLADGRRLWAEQGERFGRLTSMRIAAAPEKSLDETKLAFEKELHDRIDWPAFGFAIQPIREQMTAASRGSTDFGMLFVSFSFFLIISAATLASLLFRLLVERRAAEIGLILATGQTTRTITRLLLTEGAIVAGLGSLLGLIGSIAYSWLMLTGLSTWWSAALQTPFLHLSVSPLSLAIGFATGFLISLASIAFAVRGVTKCHPRALLAGAFGTGDATPSPLWGEGRGEGPFSKTEQNQIAFIATVRKNARLTTAITAFLLAIALIFAPFATDRIPQVAAFFGGGALLLTASILFVSAALRRAAGFSPRGRSPLEPTAQTWESGTLQSNLSSTQESDGTVKRSLAVVRKPDVAADVNPSNPFTENTSFPLLRLALSNLRRHPSRSVMTMTLIASAVFVIVSVGAFRLDVSDATDRHSGTGGFSLIAESAVPLHYDLNTPAGRKALNLTDDESQSLADIRVMSFRLRPGDDASCKNPYSKKTPRILGTTQDMITRGGFNFAATLAATPEEKENPWLLLNRNLSSTHNTPSPSEGDSGHPTTDSPSPHWGEGRGEGLPTAIPAKVSSMEALNPTGRSKGLSVETLDAPIPVIADESAVLWQLHLNLGGDLIIPDDHGQPRKLRIVAMLKNSVLQSELIMAESNFTRLFPTRSGYSFFLIDTTLTNTTSMSDWFPTDHDTHSEPRALARDYSQSVGNGHSQQPIPAQAEGPKQSRDREGAVASPGDTIKQEQGEHSRVPPGGMAKPIAAMQGTDASGGMAKRGAAMQQGQKLALLSQSLESSLAPFVFDVQPAADRLREYLVVQNTYISTFQTLGGLGLLLGVAGLAAILVRQVWERRSELALMTALGFRKTHVKRVVLLENAAILLTGITLGTAAALIAIAPQWLTQPEVVPWLKLAATLALVIALGLTLATLALNSALNKPLLPALRSE